MAVCGPLDWYCRPTPWFCYCRWKFVSGRKSTMGDGETRNRHELHWTAERQCSGRQCWIHASGKCNGREHDPRQRIWGRSNLSVLCFRNSLLVLTRSRWIDIADAAIWQLGFYQPCRQYDLRSES